MREQKRNQESQQEDLQKTAGGLERKTKENGRESERKQPENGQLRLRFPGGTKTNSPNTVIAEIGGYP
ncbi:MAG: hypothetical protein ACLTC4_23630 [Hungatella hathewayi]